MSDTPRLSFLDSARGLCMFLVVLGHIWETDAPLPVLIYSFHIPLFFVISGILLRYTHRAGRSLRAIVFSRLKSLIVPYVVFELVFVVIFGIRNGFDPRYLSGWLLLAPQNVPLWFLPTLFLVELAAVCLLRAEKSGRLMPAVFAVLYLIPFLWGSAKGDAGSVLGPVLRFFSSAGFFALGYLISGFIQKKDLPAPILLPACLLDGALALWNGKVGIYKLTFGNPLLFTLCAASGSCLLLFLLKKTRLRILELLGQNTLAILGLHIIVLRVLQEILGFHTDGLAGGLLAAALICALLTAAEGFLKSSIRRRRAVNTGNRSKL